MKIYIEALTLVAHRAQGEARNFVLQVAPELGTSPYWMHLDIVAQLLVILGVTNPEVILAGYLHDIVEDHGITLEEIEAQFGKNVRDMVDLCSKPQDYDSKNEEHVKAYYRRFLNQLEVDKEIATGAMKIKICDRLTNLQGIQHIADTERKTHYLQETIDYFLPMAKIVGWEQYIQNVILFARSVGPD